MKASIWDDVCTAMCKSSGSTQTLSKRRPENEKGNEKRQKFHTSF